MSRCAQRLGILVAAAPGSARHRHALGLAEAAVSAGVEVYVYCLDDALPGVSDPAWQALRSRGLRLFACAHGAVRRGVELTDAAVFGGLTWLHDAMAATDRFVAFN